MSDKKKIAALRARVAALRAKVKRLEKRLEESEQERILDQVGRRKELMATESQVSPLLHKLYQAQMQMGKISKHGHRWSEDMKDFSLSLFYHSPKAYKFVTKIFQLPSVRTLQNYQSKVDIEPGLLQPVLTTLKSLAAGPLSDKSENVCSLIIDEIAIRQHLHYDLKSDMIKGFADDGKERFSCRVGDHCLVAMVKGIKREWKQVIGYWISDGPISATSLLNIVHLCVSELQKIGFSVKLLVCDQGTNNQSLASKLGVSSIRPYFEIDGNVIHFMYDPPHLLKSIRNNLLRYGLEFKEGLVSWSYIRMIYEMHDDDDDDLDLRVRLVPKLTKHHVSPKMFSRMKVKLATQVFSHTVHSAIYACIGMGELPNTAVHTANFIQMMDKLFDTFNSTKVKENKFKLRFAMAPESRHVEFLEKTLDDFQSLKFVGCKRQPACLEGWKISIQSLLNLFRELVSEYNIPKLRTRLLSQDALENTFASIRQQHGCNVNPSVQQLESGLRHILITSLSKLSHRSNCESDMEDDDDDAEWYRKEVGNTGIFPYCTFSNLCVYWNGITT